MQGCQGPGSGSQVAVIIPTLNEQDSLGRVLEDIDTHLGRMALSIVVDGHSNDKTIEVALRSHAEVVFQSGFGYGDALQAGFRHALENHTPHVIGMIDGDGTYDVGDLARLIESMKAGRTDFVIGNRFSSMDPRSMSTLNKIGNIGISKMLRLVAGVKVTDTQCGLRAFKRSLAGSFVTGPKGMPYASEMIMRASQ